MRRIASALQQRRRDEHTKNNLRSNRRMAPSAACETPSVVSTERLLLKALRSQGQHSHRRIKLRASAVKVVVRRADAIKAPAHKPAPLNPQGKPVRPLPLLRTRTPTLSWRVSSEPVAADLLLW